MLEGLLGSSVLSIQKKEDPAMLGNEFACAKLSKLPALRCVRGIDRKKR